MPFISPLDSNRRVDAPATSRRSEFAMTCAVENGWVGDEVRPVIGV